jgi:16S rRNA (cytidine1402-2'-O)-methyltransferase
MKVSLSVVATPIGNLKDISLRAIETLQLVDAILCEDTRVTRKLLQRYNIRKPLFVYNDNVAQASIPRIIKSILFEDKSYALVTDAGTPLISDPGYKLVQACIENNIIYTVNPGASSILSALILSGMQSNKFFFAGFVCQNTLESLSNIDSTMIFFESPQKLSPTLKMMKVAFPNRSVAIVKEITKIYESVIRGDFDTVIAHFENNKPRGEFVIVLSPPQRPADNLDALEPLINGLVNKISSRDLSAILSKYSGIKKSKIYKRLLDKTTASQ